MQFCLFDTVGDVGNLNEEIIKILVKIGDFPKEVRVVNRLIKLDKKTGLLKASVICVAKN